MDMDDILGQVKVYIMLTLGTIIMAVGVYFFKMPNNFTFGGITGFSVIVAKLGLMSATRFTTAANLILLVVGFVFLGRGMGVKTTYCTLVLTGAIEFLNKLFPMHHPLTDQPLMECFFAVGLPALASAILFNLNATSGGTDVIAMIMKKYTSIDIGKALMLTDVGVTIAAFFVFDAKTGLYSVLGLSIRSFLVDGLIESINQHKYFNVVCENPDPICDYITGTLGRSATVCDGKGAFSGGQRYIIFTVMNRQEAVKLRNYIKMNEPRAFILITNTSQIIGKGFHTV